MSADLRARYTNQRVMTATPGQRLVMLYDRLALDLRRAHGEQHGNSGAAAAATAANPGMAAANPGAQPAAASTGPAESAVIPTQKAASDAAAANATAAASAPATATSTKSTGEHIDHAMQIVAELAGSLKAQPGVADSPVENLASLYGYLLGELSAARAGDTDRLPGALSIVEALREAWTEAVASTTSATAASGSRVG